jgi:hypothetical protein
MIGRWGFTADDDSLEDVTGRRHREVAYMYSRALAVRHLHDEA